MAAEGLFAAYALLQMLAFLGFAASKMVTLLLLFTITVGLDWDQLFLLRAHTLLKRMIVTLSLLLMLCASAFVFFHVKSVATRVGIDRGSTNNSSQLQLRDDYRHACLSEGMMLLSQSVFLSLILLGLSAAILKVKPVTRDGPSTMAQPLLGMTDTWFSSPPSPLLNPRHSCFPHPSFHLKVIQLAVWQANRCLRSRPRFSAGGAQRALYDARHWCSHHEGDLRWRRRRSECERHASLARRTSHTTRHT
jgi:hypothetical protein